MATALNVNATADMPANRPDMKPILEEALAATERRQTLVSRASQQLGIDERRLLPMLRNVWKTSKGEPPLTDEEMFVGIGMIARFGLDPIAREIYVTRSKDRLMTIVGIDGWVKILDRTDGYDGFEQELSFDKEGKVVWCETKIHSKLKSHPSVYRAYAVEYFAIAGFVGGKMPLHMLRIFSLRHAARLFTPLGASVMLEEEAEFAEAHRPVREPVPLPQPLPSGATEQADANAHEPTDASWNDLLQDREQQIREATDDREISRVLLVLDHDRDKGLPEPECERLRELAKDRLSALLGKAHGQAGKGGGK